LEADQGHHLVVHIKDLWLTMGNFFVFSHIFSR
jgi:hypothetical protein